MLGHSFVGEAMAIIEDYDAIAKRIRDLNLPTAPAKETDLDRWRDLAADTARIYVQNRRTGPLADVILQRRRQLVRRP